MSHAGQVTLKTGNLTRLIRGLGELPRLSADVGIFADADERVNVKTEDSNATLGLIHEDGQPEENIPRRSFLHDPLTQKLGPAIEDTGVEIWLRRVMFSTPQKMVEQLGVLGEDVVQQAFETRGFGNWPALHPSTIKKKGSSAILIESGELRQSIASRVV